MKRLLAAWAVIGGLAAAPGCLGPREDDSARFAQFVRLYLDHCWRTNPERATADGVHEYDELLSPTSAADFQKEAANLRSFLSVLGRIEDHGLSLDRRIDKRLMTADIRLRLAQLERERAWERDPTVYIPFDGLNDLVRKDFAPAEERAASLLERLRQVPPILENARRNLKRPPKLFTEASIRTVRGMTPFYQRVVPQFARSVPALETEILRAALEESSAAGEINIYAFRPSYAISYMVGYREILKLRQEYREKRGARFSLRQFHDRLLTQGSMPFPLVRELVLTN